MPWNAILPGVILLGLVIFVHELGHFLVAKWRGVTVLKFSLGFGPALFKFTHAGTEYRISWIPLGGYVQMAGDTPGTDGSMPDTQTEFLSHSWFGRLLICIAGPAANLLTAFLILVVVWMVGISYPDHPNLVGATPDTSAAYQAGIREGDRIVGVAGRPVGSWVAIFQTNSSAPNTQAIEVDVARGDRRFSIHLDPGQREVFFSSLHYPPDPPIVGSVLTGMPAYLAGVKEGDRILAVDGHPVSTWDEIPRALVGTVDRPVVLRIRRDTREFDLAVTPMNPDGHGTKRAQIGIGAPRGPLYVVRHGLLESTRIGFEETIAMVRSVYGGMWLTVSRLVYYRGYVGGPLFIAQVASEQAKLGLDAYLHLVAMINIAVMAFNLLPLPMLDGGHILLALIEAVRRQGLSAQSYLRFQKVGLVVLGGMFILILANDPLRLVQRQRALDSAPSSTAPERPVAPP